MMMSVVLRKLPSHHGEISVMRFLHEAAQFVFKLFRTLHVHVCIFYMRLSGIVHR